MPLLASVVHKRPIERLDAIAPGRVGAYWLQPRSNRVFRRSLILSNLVDVNPSEYNRCRREESEMYVESCSRNERSLNPSSSSFDQR